VDAPMGAEFYETCGRIEYTQSVLGTEEVSKVFMLAVDGLTRDMPATKVLRRRLEVLIDRFIRD
jgi:TetR/AcrR family transcriptional regulator, transcriptional repressor of aconitase